MVSAFFTSYKVTLSFALYNSSDASNSPSPSEIEPAFCITFAVLFFNALTLKLIEMSVESPREEEQLIIQNKLATLTNEIKFFTNFIIPPTRGCLKKLSFRTLRFFAHTCYKE